MKDYRKLSEAIILNVGGKDNIKDVSHCMTRLRLGLKDESKVNKDELEKLDEVMRVVVIGGQYQVVLGGIVDDVFDETCKLVGDSVVINETQIEENLDNTETSNKKAKPVEKLISLLSGIVSPIIPAMLAAGFITALAKLLVLAGIPETNTTIQLLTVAGDVLYGFFPIFIGWSAAKYFGANISIVLMVVGLLVYPNFSNVFSNFESVTFLGLPVTNVYYGSSVLPAILTAFLIAKLEKILRKILPNALRSIFVPFLSVLITIPLLIVVIGPIGVWGGELFANLFRSTYELSPILAGAIIGGTWQILIIFGMHIAILGLVSAPNIAMYGRDTIIMTHAPSLICQITAGLAVALKAKDKKIKKNALTLSLTSFFSGNVIEPVMYGVNLKYKKPFIAVCIGGAIGGAITGAAGAGTVAAVAFSLYTFPVYLGVGFGGLLLGCLVGGLVTFVLTYVMGIDEKDV